MNTKISVMISEEEINKRVCEIAEQISKDYAGKEVRLICILKGSVFYTCELAKRITIPVTLDFMSVSSYGSGTVSSGTIKIKKDLDDDIEGLDVIVVEDIIDSGNTLSLRKENRQALRLQHFLTSRTEERLTMLQLTMLDLKLKTNS